MFAIVRTGGKQYRVATDDEIIVERLAGEPGDRLDLVSLAIGGGTPAAVVAEIVGHTRGEKIIIFKKKRRHNYRRRNGHRQNHTVLKILGVGDERPVETNDGA